MDSQFERNHDELNQLRKDEIMKIYNIITTRKEIDKDSIKNDDIFLCKNSKYFYVVLNTSKNYVYIKRLDKVFYRTNWENERLKVENEFLFTKCIYYVSVYKSYNHEYLGNIKKISKSKLLSEFCYAGNNEAFEIECHIDNNEEDDDKYEHYDTIFINNYYYFD